MKLDDVENGINERLSRLGLNDPTGYVDGANLYEFELGDPINGLDPAGLWRQGEGDTIIVEQGNTPGQIAQDLTGSSQNWQQVFPGLDDPTLLQVGPHDVPHDIMEGYRNRHRPPTSRPATRPTSRPATNPATQPCPDTQPATRPATRPATQPNNLATQDNIDELARVLMSEASIGNADERRGVGNTILNRMRRNATNSVADVTGHGAYARNQDPTQAMRDLAQQMLAGQIPDNTNGATHFYSPRSMNPPNSVPPWAGRMTRENVPNCRDDHYRFYRAPGDGAVR